MTDVKPTSTTVSVLSVFTVPAKISLATSAVFVMAATRASFATRKLMSVHLIHVRMEEVVRTWSMATSVAVRGGQQVVTARLTTMNVEAIHV